MRLVVAVTEGADEYVSLDFINHGIWVVVETDGFAITSSMAPVPTSCAASGGKFPDPRKQSGELQLPAYNMSGRTSPKAIANVLSEPPSPSLDDDRLRSWKQASRTQGASIVEANDGEE
ncbi:hypothetical protein PG984_005714 [Apiospora sp. TS-2023a]